MDRLAGFIVVSFLLLKRVRQQVDVLHLKGFAMFIDFADAKVKAAEEKAIRYLRSRRPKCIVWDGDSFGDDSFTRIIARYAAENEKARFIMSVPQRVLMEQEILKWQHLLDGRVDVRETNVCGSGKPIKHSSSSAGVVEAREFLHEDYCAHGLRTLELTGAKHVLVFGVGPCVADEIRTLERAGGKVLFTAFDVVRHHPKRGRESSHCVFSQGSPTNVTFLDLE